jgi:hypothetical protein
MKRIFLSIVGFLFVFQSFGWGLTGHRAVGLIAEQHLSKKAKKKLKLLLDQQSLAMVSNWMDDVKSDSTFDYMEDWHWVTVENGQVYDQSKKNPNGDIIMTLERVIAELKSHKLDRAKEIEAIKILTHLIGDIHQPLHVGCCDDAGGGKVSVKWFGATTNIHTVWDSRMIDDTKLSYTEFASALGDPDVSTIASWQHAGVRDWANESMSYRKQVYDVGNGNLSYQYSYKYLGIAKERVLKAGIRLAGILNEIYK